MVEGEVVPLDPHTVQRKHLSLPLTCLSLSHQYPNNERIKGRRQRIAAHTNFSAAISLSVHSGHIGILLTPGSGSASLKYKDKGSPLSASHSFFPLALLLVDFPAGMISLDLFSFDQLLGNGGRSLTRGGVFNPRATTWRP